MLQRASNYQDLRKRFSWRVPESYNIGTDVVDRHADAGRTALIYERDDGGVAEFTFRDIRRLSNRLANALIGKGIGRGDRIAILLPQSPETAIGHVATYKIGAIALPLFTLFGPDALRYRLSDSGARALITDMTNLEKVMDMRADLPSLEFVIVTDGHASAGVESFDVLLDKARDEMRPIETRADDPALIIYTSGTTGNPKGALHAHRVLLGHLPGVELPHNFPPQPGDLFWTPADWAWIGGLLDVLMPAWHHGIPVLAHRPGKFDPEQAFHLMAKHHVRNTFLPPTALKLMRQISHPKDRYAYALRSLASGGETLGAELMEWGRATFDLNINEFYGQTECNVIVGNCGELMDTRPGSMGCAIPGHDVRIVDDAGNILPSGVAGNIGVRSPDSVMFLEYWRKPAATREKFAGDWLITGDTGLQDSDGYFWFKGRNDDVITSGGYRIGPTEIEDCLITHPAVSMAAVVGRPDPVRTEIVKAFIVLAESYSPSDQLRADIQTYIRTRLAAHEYPREIEFIDELPLTITGKIMRRELRARDKSSS